MNRTSMLLVTLLSALAAAGVGTIGLWWFSDLSAAPDEDARSSVRDSTASPPVHTVRGIVTTADGVPASGVLIFHNNDVFRVVRGNTRYAAAETNTRGRFQIRRVSQSANTLFAWKKGYAIATNPLEEDVHFTLKPGGTIVGKVAVGGERPPVEYRIGATVTEVGENRFATLDSEGNYRLENLMEVPYNLYAAPAGAYPGRPFYILEKQVLAEDGSVVTADFNIPAAGAKIQGFVVSEGGPLRDGLVRCAIEGLTFQVQTDENGGYVIENVPAGIATLRVVLPQVTKTGHYNAQILYEQILTIASDGTLTHDIMLP